jgi:diphthamide synthase subunit DPH2
MILFFMKRRNILIFIVIACAVMRCTPVREYQKMHLNDAEMELAARKTQKFETSFQLYREGASGANGGKNGGGCGCN